MDASMFMQETVEQYLRDLSKRGIVPGGGSASALTAALGAALNLMVINYSMKEDDPERATKALLAARKRQQESLDHLSLLVDEDCGVFRDLMAALAAKQDAQKEYIAAATVPMKICRECHISLDIADHLLESANRKLLSDVGCAAHMLSAAFSSAELNVEINLRHIEDRAFVENTKKILEGMKKDIDHTAGGIRVELKKEINLEGGHGGTDQRK